MNFPQAVQYESVRGFMPRTGRCSNRGAGDFEDMGLLGLVLRILLQLWSVDDNEFSGSVPSARHSATVAGTG